MRRSPSVTDSPLLLMKDTFSKSNTASMVSMISMAYTPDQGSCNDWKDSTRNKQSMLKHVSQFSYHWKYFNYKLENKNIATVMISLTDYILYMTVTGDDAPRPTCLQSEVTVCLCSHVICIWICDIAISLLCTRVAPENLTQFNHNNVRRLF